jgi:Zn-dependent protease with chaperone function
MKILLSVTLSVVVALSGCKIINAVASGDTNAALREGAVVAKKGVEGGKKISECNAFASKEVTWEEEVSLGGAVALAMAAKTKGVFIELSPDLKGTLDTSWANKKPSVGSGPKTELHAYLNALGKALAASSQRPGIEWKFVVLEDEAVNAFSAPGGYVMVTTGALKAVDNEAQLAGILAHEVGHTAKRHAVDSYQQTKKLACYGAFGLGTLTEELGEAVKDAIPVPDNVKNELASLISSGGFNLDKASGKLVTFLSDKTADAIVNKGFGKEREVEADSAAVEMMIFSSLEPNEFKKLISKLPDGGGVLVPHPSNAERVATVDKVVKDNQGFMGALKTPALGAQVKTALK